MAEDGFSLAGLPTHPDRVLPSIEGRKTTVTRIKPKTDNFPRVIRGGGWFDSDAAEVRAADAAEVRAADRYNGLGFRCAQRGCRQQVLKVTP